MKPPKSNISKIYCLIAMALLFALAEPVYAQKFYQCEEGEEAQVKVWAAESAEEADFWVFFVYDASELGPEGVIMQVPTIEEADFSLTFVDIQEEAMFSLWIVDLPEQAGWQNKEKAQILDPFIKKE